MSTLILQVGQAGNQMGAHLWSRAVHQAHATQQLHLPLPPSSLPLPLSTCLSYSPFFSSSGHAIALLVDTEPKVLQSIYSLSISSVLKPPPFSPPDARASTSLFHRNSLFYDQYGRGNNWALGYAGRQQSHSTLSTRSTSPLPVSSPPSFSSSSMIDSILDRVRVEAERMDIFDSLLLLHSVGGGTGAGLGSHLLERLRSDYPSHFITTASILPFQRGETPLQHYNTCLTLHHLQQYTDAVLLFQNDSVLDLLSSLLRRGDKSKGAAPLPFSVLNSYIADCIADVISPIGGGEGSRLSSLPHLLSGLCPLPGLKLLDTWTSSGVVLTSSHDPMSWSTVSEVMDKCTQIMMGGVGGGGGEGKKTARKVIEFSLIARGESNMKMEAWDRQKLDERIGRHLPLVKWNERPVIAPPSSQPKLGAARYAGWVGDRLLVDGSGPSMSVQEGSLSLVVNHAKHVGYMKGVLKKGRAMYEKRAYVHWYERFGCGQEQFSAAFDGVQQVIDDYEQWTAE